MTSIAKLLPISALEQHIAILGKTGSGKSNAAKVIAEFLMKSGERVCVLDPTGSWWGLRLMPDGTPSPFKPIIFGGEHGDLPLGEQHGALVAEAIGTSSDSAIIDTRAMTVGQRTRFFTAFAETLLRANHGPLTLIVDEAHVFVPQGRTDPQGGAAVHAGNNLVSLGRGCGLRIILISQRPQKLHKDSLTQTETLIAMRLIHNLDVDAVKAWIGEQADPARGRELVGSLASLGAGDAWIWSPQADWLVRGHFPLVSTFDSGKPPSRSDVAPTLAPIDATELGDKMDAIRQQAMENDPKRLRAEIERLKREKEPRVVVDQAAVDAAYKTGNETGFKAGMDAGSAAERQRLHRKLLDFIGIEVAESDILNLKPIHPTAPPEARKIQPKLQMAASAPETVAHGLTKALQRALDSIAWWRCVGFYEVMRDRAAITAGLSPRASTFGVYLSKLKELGLVDNGQPGCVKLTEAGVSAANFPPSAEVDKSQVIAMAFGLLKPQAARVLGFVADAYPNAISRDALADKMGLSRTASTLGVYLSESTKLGLIETAGRGEVRAADWLFP